jgi:RNA polymerase sigma-70 factor (ECF subfamily)
MDLLTTYVSALPSNFSPPMERAEIQRALEAFCEDACAAVGGLAAHLPEFVRTLAANTVDGAPPPRERAVDLALAFAAGQGDAEAVARIDVVAVSAAKRAAAAIDSSQAFTDLVAQELRTHLYVGERPRIREYSGRGPLAGWLHICARRLALNLRRGNDARKESELSSKLEAVVDAPETAYLRARYRGDFEDALRAALAKIPARERMALCLNVRDGVSGNQLASMYGISAATAKRLLARARELLLQQTAKELRARLGITHSEFESLARALYSEVEVSIVRLLQEGSPERVTKLV